MQLNSDRDDEHDDDSFGSEGSRPVERSYKPIDAVGSVGLPLEKRLRSRIDNFLAGYRLTRMGKAIALSWIQVCGRSPVSLGLATKNVSPSFNPVNHFVYSLVVDHDRADRHFVSLMNLIQALTWL